jgi:glycosyltransferase involved in cell wall biosynthesis
VLLIIPTFNNVTYLRNTVDRFSNIVDDIMVFDSGSTYPPMMEYLSAMDSDLDVHLFGANFGPRWFYNSPALFDSLPQEFLLTDPDMFFDDRLDRESLEHLFELGREMRSFKIGSALSLEVDDPAHIDKRLIWSGREISVREIETGYYDFKIDQETKYGDPIYVAAIDTTFSAYLRQNHTGFMNDNLRVGGRYAAGHYGWWVNPPVPIEEQVYYTQATLGSQFSSSETTRRGENYAY